MNDNTMTVMQQSGIYVVRMETNGKCQEYRCTSPAQVQNFITALTGWPSRQG